MSRTMGNCPICRRSMELARPQVDMMHSATVWSRAWLTREHTRILETICGLHTENRDSKLSRTSDPPVQCTCGRSVELKPGDSEMLSAIGKAWSALGEQEHGIAVAVSGLCGCRSVN